MNKGAIPIVARLAALQVPAQVAPGRARVIAGVDDASPLTALLREVNETIIGRTLRIESSGGTGLTLEVAGRRVLRLTEASGLAGAEACLAAEALEDDHKDALIKLMQAVTPPRHELRVTSLASGQAADAVSVGLPVALLADLLLIDLNPVDAAEGDPPPPAPPAPAPTVESRRDALRASARSEPQPVAATAKTPVVAPVTRALPRSLDQLAQGIGPVLVAWLIRGGDSDGRTDGAEEMVTHLQGFLDDEAEALQHQLDVVAGQPGASVCIVLGATLVEGHSLLCARSGDGLLLGVIDGDVSQTLAAAWAGAAG